MKLFTDRDTIFYLENQNQLKVSSGGTVQKERTNPGQSDLSSADSDPRAAERDDCSGLTLFAKVKELFCKLTRITRNLTPLNFQTNLFSGSVQIHFRTLANSIDPDQTPQNVA